MTRETACKKAQIIDIQGGYTIALVTEIFNDHEDAIEMLLKANEEGISRHFNECDKYEAQLKAKDEEIERLKHDARHIELQHDNCGGIIEIDYQLYVRNYETFCPKCNKDLFVTIDFNTRVIKD